MNAQKPAGAPSQTAFFVALRRALANKEYQDAKFGPDYLAELFLPAYYRFFLRFEWVRANTRKRLAEAMPGMNEYLIARTAFFDGLFSHALKDQIPQIVLLGAGYDSRGYRFAKSNRGTRIFELDAAPTQNRKIQCLQAAHLRIPDEIQYTPINFLDESLGNVLAKAGYQHHQRALFLWEGVSYYLDFDAVKGTLDFVSQCSHKDSVIAFDYTISTTEENTKAYYGADLFLEAMKAYHTDEKLLFSIEEGDLEPFLVDRRLRLIEHLDQKAIEQKYLTGDDGSLIGRMIGIFRFACASPV